MNNIIKIILRQSGGLAEMVKTIPLYVGMYNTAILDVYVPQNLVSEGISVKVGAILTANDGTKATTDSLPMTYKGEETFCNEEYSVYELNPFPANFLTYAGQQDLVVNIVTIENEEVSSVVTTQICKVDVLDSALIPDEELEASAVDLLSARITTNEQNIATNTDNITANTGQIAQNTQDISENTQKIAEIEQKMSTGENYVGSLTVSTLTGIETELNNLVQQVESREPANGDVVMVTLEVTGGTDEIYKYFYTADGWQSYQMPSIESASNTDKGIIKGTLGENKNTQVDIAGGEINAIYVKDNNNVLRDIREYANTTKTSIDNIISGDTKVGHSVKADQDQNGNEITNTYLTQNAGVTKTQMREYALPREFNDIYYLSKDQSNRPIITKDKPSQALTFTGDIHGIGTYPLIFADFISDASFELSSKNSYQSTFFVSVASDVTAQFRLDIIYMGEIISTEFSNEMVMSANNIYKVQFNENFNNLEDVIQYDGQYPIKIMLSVVQTTSDTNTYTAYQNSTYVSTFNLNTNKYVISLQNGNLGEIKSIAVDGYEIEQGIISFEMIDDEHLLKNNCLVEFKLSFNGSDLTKQIKLVQTFSSGTNEEYHLKTPYNTDAFNDRPTIEDFKQTSITIAGGVTTIRFIGLVKVIDGYGTEIFVNEDNLTEILALINSKQDALSTTQLNAVNSGIDSTKVAQITTNATNITNLQNGKVDKTTTINNKALTQDIMLDANDVGALPNDTTFVSSVNGRSGAVTGLAEASDIPTKTSDLTNDSGFITNVVNDLTNYYLKNETYTQSQVNALIAAIKTVKLEIVSTLPTADVTTYFNESKTIYAIRNTATTGSDYYEEYITIRTGSEGSYVYSWEKIGDTQIDLSNYVQKTFTIAGIDLQDNITKSELQTALTDSTHNFVTDAEKSTWNSKQDTLTQAQLDAINSGITANGVTQISTNATNISNNTIAIGANTSAISGLTTRMGTAEDNISAIPNNYVSYTATQSLTEAQKLQARTNIGAGDSGFTGDYTDLRGKPVLKTNNTTAQNPSASETIDGTINLHKVAKTGTASDLIGYSDLAQASTVTNLANTVGANTSAISTINGKIPSAATTTNQLADKAFVNSSIATNTATFRGTYNLVSDLNLTTSATQSQVATALASAISTADANDYCFVQVPTANATPTQIKQVDRYKYNGTAWVYEYTLNNSGFTANQWAAINSGANTTNIGAIANKVDKSTTIAGIDLQDNITKTELQTALTDTTHNFVTNTEKSTWNNKNGATTYSLVSDSGQAATSGYVRKTISKINGQFLTFHKQYSTSASNSFSGGAFTNVLLAWVEQASTEDTQSQRTTLRSVSTSGWSINGNFKHWICVIGFTN